MKTLDHLYTEGFQYTIVIIQIYRFIENISSFLRPLIKTCQKPFKIARVEGESVQSAIQ